jgi:hypothetical protein
MALAGEVEPRILAFVALHFLRIFWGIIDLANIFDVESVGRNRMGELEELVVGGCWLPWSVIQHVAGQLELLRRWR